jgi:hypothetical protein
VANVFRNIAVVTDDQIVATIRTKKAAVSENNDQSLFTFCFFLHFMISLFLIWTLFSLFVQTLTNPKLNAPHHHVLVAIRNNGCAALVNVSLFDLSVIQDPIVGIVPMKKIAVSLSLACFLVVSSLYLHYFNSILTLLLSSLL